MGVQIWFLQRLSAVILIFYMLFLGVYLFGHYPLDYLHWIQLWSSAWFKTAHFLAMLSLSFHAYVGLDIIIHDYVKVVKLRIIILSLVSIAILSYLFWSMRILWAM